MKRKINTCFEWIKRKAIGRNVIIGTAGAILVQKICFSIPGVYQKFEFRQSLATNPCTRAYEEPLAKTGAEKSRDPNGLTEVELTDRKAVQLLSRG